MTYLSSSIPRTRKPTLSRGVIAAVTVALAWMALSSHAQSPAKKIAYPAFPLLQSRNIFDPDRSRDRGIPQNSNRTVRAERTPPPVQVRPNDYVVLTGILMADGQTMAFFAGSQTEYNKVVPLNGAIAGATVTKITPSSIDVQRDGKTVTVPVGQTVPFDDSAPGLPPSATTTAAPPAAIAPAASTLDPQAVSDGVPVPSPTSAPTNSSPPAGNTNDVMRRMMERRQKELQ